MGLGTQAAVLSLGDNPVTGDPSLPEVAGPYCHPDRLQSLSGDNLMLSLPGVNSGLSLNRVNSGGKTKPECGQRYPMDWDPGPNKKEKVIFISLLTDCGCKMASQF